MRQRFAPTHSIVEKAAVIPIRDTAWDYERINAEVARSREAAGYDPSRARVGVYDPEDPGNEHPVMRYFAGRTRYDLDAEDVRSYLRMEMHPEIWRIRSLTLDERAADEVRTRADNPFADKMVVLACTVSLETPPGPELGDSELAASGTRLAELLREKRRNDEKVWHAFGQYSANVISELAGAIRTLSLDLSVEEKKASAGPRGPGSAPPTNPESQ